MPILRIVGIDTMVASISGPIMPTWTAPLLKSAPTPLRIRICMFWIPFLHSYGI